MIDDWKAAYDNLHKKYVQGGEGMNCAHKTIHDHSVLRDGLAETIATDTNIAREALEKWKAQ